MIYYFVLLFFDIFSVDCLFFFFFFFSSRRRHTRCLSDWSSDVCSSDLAAVVEKPHLVLLDISLAAGDGFTVAERIQSNIPTPIPMIFLTASKRPEFRQRAQRLGAVGFFEKPFRSEEHTSELQSLRHLVC